MQPLEALFQPGELGENRETAVRLLNVGGCNRDRAGADRIEWGVLAIGF